MATSPPKNFIGKNETTIVVRHAIYSDAAALVELSRRVLSNGEGQVRLPEEFLRSEKGQRDLIHKYQEDSGCLFLIAEVNGSIVGCLDFKNGSQARIAHRGVLGMGVDPDWRNVGIGRGLLTTLDRMGQRAF